MEWFTADQFTVVFRTVGIFLWALVLLRILGRKRLSHLTYIDLLLIISFGSAVGDVMIYPESTAKFLTSIVSITVVGIVVKLLDELSSHSGLANRIIDGHSQIVIERGKVVEGVLARENMSEETLLSLLREHGADAIHKVRWAYLEPDGELSVAIYKKFRQ